MKIFSVRQTVLPALLVLSPVVFAADEQTMIVSAAPQVVSELDTPAAVSVVDGEEMRLATPRINLSESLTGVPGLQVQNRQNYAQDLQLSIRGFGSRSTYGIRGIRLYVDGIPATMPDGCIDSLEVRKKPGGHWIIRDLMGLDLVGLASL